MKGIKHNFKERNEILINFNDVVSGARYNFPVGHVLTDAEILQLVEDFQFSAGRDIHVQRSTFTNFIPATHVRQTEPLLAGGGTSINLFFTFDVFEAVFDLSAEADDVNIRYRGNTFTNQSAPHSVYTWVQMSPGGTWLNSSWVQTEVARTQAQIYNGYAYISRPGYSLASWQWTSGQFTTQNADGTWPILLNRQMLFDNLSNPMAALITPPTPAPPLGYVFDSWRVGTVDGG